MKICHKEFILNMIGWTYCASEKYHHFPIVKLSKPYVNFSWVECHDKYDCIHSSKR